MLYPGTSRAVVTCTVSTVVVAGRMAAWSWTNYSPAREGMKCGGQVLRIQNICFGKVQWDEVSSGNWGAY